MMELPRLRHKNCKTHGCDSCLADTDYLRIYLEKMTNNRNIDHLSRYYHWLSGRGIEPETEYGWPTEEVFDEFYIRGYINDFKELGK